MKLILKVCGLVFLYLMLAAWGVTLILPVAGAPTNESNKVYRQAIDESLGTPNEKSRDVSVLILPHHLVADRQIQSGFAHIAAARKKLKTRRIILMGPNHFFRGEGSVITADTKWRTNFGTIEADAGLINMLGTQHIATVQDAVVEGDHAITALVPFIERFFPEASLTPLLMREPMPLQDTDAFGKMLSAELTEEDLIIASVDFSHYLPKFASDFHDEATIAALHNLDLDFFHHSIDADAPQVLMTLHAYLKARGHQKLAILHHTNSSVLVANPYETSTTSHFVAYFEKGAPTNKEQLALILKPSGNNQGDPLLYKGADFIIKSGETKQLTKNGLKVNVSTSPKGASIATPSKTLSWDESRGPAGILVTPHSTRLCYFFENQCI